jgi:hypothetical protein
MHTRKARPCAVAARHLLYDEWVCEWYPFFRQDDRRLTTLSTTPTSSRCCLLLVATLPGYEIDKDEEPAEDDEWETEADFVVRGTHYPCLPQTELI